MSITRKEKEALNKGRRAIKEGKVLRGKSGVPPRDIHEALKKRSCSFLVKFKKEHSISSKELASICKVNESKMSKILSYHIDAFSLDLVVKCVDRVVNSEPKALKSLSLDELLKTS